MSHATKLSALWNYLQELNRPQYRSLIQVKVNYEYLLTFDESKQNGLNIRVTWIADCVKTWSFWHSVVFKIGEVG